MHLILQTFPQDRVGLPNPGVFPSLPRARPLRSPARECLSQALLLGSLTLDT